MIINDTIKLAVVIITDKSTGGVIGLAADTVDISTYFSIQQNTANQILTLPNPTNGGFAYICHIKNTGNVTFTMHNFKINSTEIGTFIFQNGAWSSYTNQTSGNIITALSNVTPTTIMNVGGLFEISMPASVDVQIRALTARAIYILSEGEYPGGSFATGTGALVNLGTTFTNADNGVHVAGERSTITIQDVLTNKVFKITVWRFGAVAGNWSGWVEEIGINSTQILTAGAGITLSNGVVAATAGTITRAVVRASGMTATASAGSGTAVTFATKEKDTTNSFTATTGIFIAPRTGDYRVSAQFFNSSSAATIGSRFGIILSTNAASFGAGNPIISCYVATLNQSNTAWGGSYIKTLNAGDSLTLRAFLDNSTAMSIAPNANFDFITIEEINSKY